VTPERARRAAADPRRAALAHAGLAVALALVLLLVMLWYDEQGAPPGPAAPDLAVADTTALESPAPDVSAPPEASAPDLPDAPAEAAAAREEDAARNAARTGEPAHAPEESRRQDDAVAPSAPLPDGYLVQLGVFGSMDNAERLRENARALRLPAHLQTRVVVGPFRSKREAEAARDRLKGVAEGIVLPPRHAAGAARRQTR
jgi:DedD protein